MKKYISWFSIILLMSSCAKDQEIELVKMIGSYNYFPEFTSKTEERSYFNNIGTYNLGLYYPNPISEYSNFGVVFMEDSYVYENSSFYDVNYLESISVKKISLGTVYFKIKEEHKHIFRYDSNGNRYVYDVEFSEFELDVIRKGMDLNTSWKNSQNIVAKYTSYNGSPAIEDETDFVTFNYLVEKVEGQYHSNSSSGNTKIIDNVVTVKISYSIFGRSHVRYYYFAEGFGLVSMNIDGNSVNLE